MKKWDLIKVGKIQAVGVTEQRNRGQPLSECVGLNGAYPFEGMEEYWLHSVTVEAVLRSVGE